MKAEQSGESTWAGYMALYTEWGNMTRNEEAHQEIGANCYELGCTY